MKYNNLIFILVAMVLALVSLSQAGGGFAQTCVNIRNDPQGNIRARCSGHEDDSQVDVIFNLNLYIANYNGNLAWARNGNYINSCRNCRTLQGGRIMGCDCLAFGGRTHYTEIHLNERITNDNAKLFYRP